MSTVTIPSIRREDFDNFRQDIGLSASVTYDGWSAIMAKQVDDVRRSGGEIFMATVNHDEFRAHCLKYALRPDHQRLLEFAGQRRLHGLARSPIIAC